MVNANPSLFIGFFVKVTIRVEYPWGMVMELPSPSVLLQDGGAETSAETEVQTTPLIEAPGTALWVGFGAFISIFFLVILLIIRSRVIAPAKRKTMNAEFFEPAGDGAEITFENPDHEEQLSPRERRKREKKKKREERQKKKRQKDARIEQHHSEPVLETQGSPPAEQQDFERQEEQSESKGHTPSPFAGLFSKKEEKRERDRGDLHHDNDDYSEDEPVVADDWREHEAEHGDFAEQ